MAPEAAIRGVKMVEQEIDVVAEKIRQLDTQMRQNRQAGEEADKARTQRLQEEAEALKQFDADCKAQESGLQATVARLKTEESLLTTSVKTREAQIQAWYDEQRLMADKFAQQQLAEESRRAAAIQ
jgi:hypothetical protein